MALSADEFRSRVLAACQRIIDSSERLCEALGKIMKSDHVGTWLDTPNDAFSGLKPLDLIERGEMDRLWRMIFEIESGALG